MGAKKSKCVIVTIPVVIYNIHVFVFVNGGAKNIIDYAKELGLKLSKRWIKGLDSQYKGNGLGFCTYYGEDNIDILIGIKKPLLKASDYGTLYHEIYHAVFWILKDHSIKDEEAGAYLYEYISTECNRVLWNR